MEVKILEIRDRITFIPVIAIKMSSQEPEESYLLTRAGYAPDTDLILLIRLFDNQATYDPYDWRSSGSRTMFEAHKYITNNFEQLQHGDVIDIEFILNETDTPKQPIRLERLGDMHHVD